MGLFFLITIDFDDQDSQSCSYYYDKLNIGCSTNDAEFMVVDSNNRKVEALDHKTFMATLILKADEHEKMAQDLQYHLKV